MSISLGDNLPEATFFTMGEDGLTSITTSQLVSGRKVVLFAVPGAFTPTCHKNHLPGFVDKAEEIMAKGVDEIAVISVNDPFVMDAWLGITGAEGKIRFLCDSDATFTQAVGLDLDMSARGLGIRSKRYAMIVDDGKVSMIGIDGNPGEVDESSAGSVLANL